MTAPASISRLDAHGMRQLLRDQCHAHGGQGALAQRLGVSAQTMSDVLLGKIEPSEKLARKLGFDRHLIFIARAEV